MRKKLKRAGLLAGVMVFTMGALCGCSTSTGGTKQTYAWVLGTASPEDTVTGIYANTFAELVEEYSGGELKIQVYHNSTLGGDTELIESCQCGDIPFVVQNTAPEVSYLPKLCLFDLPCVFDNLDQLHEVLDNEEFMEKINAIYADGGFRLLGMADQNFRVMTSNKKIEAMGDFSGVKIRTMENSYHMEFWKSIGANPTPMAFAELYTGLSQSTVDAQENPYEVICSNRFYEVQNYVVETNHLPHLLALITNEEFYQNLPEDQKAIIDRAAEDAKQYAREKAVARSDARIAEIAEHNTKSHTCEILPVSDELRGQMREASKDLYEEIRMAVDDDELYEMYVGR